MYNTGFYFYDWTYILVLIAAVLTMIASARVRSTFSKYAKVRNANGMTGAEAAERILRTRGIYDVSIVQASGNLTDHYDPRNKTLALSESTYGKSSIAAVSVAAHECGHALQHEKNYTPLTIRSYLVPFANFGSKAGVPLILIGLIFSFGILIEIGIWVFAAAVLFQFVTLPVEFNASTRGVEELETLGILTTEELRQGKKVLRAAALTYVAAAASAVLQLLRFVLLSRGRSRD